MKSDVEEDEAGDGGSDGSCVQFFHDGVPVSPHQIHAAADAAAGSRRPISRRRTPPPGDHGDSRWASAGVGGRRRSQPSQRRSFSPPPLPQMSGSGITERTFASIFWRAGTCQCDDVDKP